MECICSVFSAATCLSWARGGWGTESSIGSYLTTWICFSNANWIYFSIPYISHATWQIVLMWSYQCKQLWREDTSWVALSKNLLLHNCCKYRSAVGSQLHTCCLWGQDWQEQFWKLNCSGRNLAWSSDVFHDGFFLRLGWGFPFPPFLLFLCMGTGIRRNAVYFAPICPWPVIVGRWVTFSGSLYYNKQFRNVSVTYD